jgi:hypothetical protein
LDAITGTSKVTQWFEAARPARAKRKHEEDDEQVALMKWARLNEKKYPGLEWLFMIPNGTRLAGTPLQRQITGARLKKMGLKAGVSDLFLPTPKHGRHGLFIELKSKIGTPSDEQLSFGQHVLDSGYCFHICRGWEAAAEVIRAYYS